uniref:Ribosomal protein L2 n=2 Tax=Chromera velia TaxID=505693 RepID=D9IXJ1_9ALVE|nr:ribosomal protein L2 [Chromera velia]ADJ66519.1 ribosomal protein L2 [Chromera velia]
MVLKTQTVGLHFFNPRTPGTRHRIGVNYRYWKINGHSLNKSLRFHQIRRLGLDFRGHKVTRKRCSGTKQNFTWINFSWSPLYPYLCVVKEVSYDPYRTSFVALLVILNKNFKYGNFTYVLATNKSKAGEIVELTYKQTIVNVGDVTKLEYFPVGSEICCLELVPFGGAVFARAAGTLAILVSRSTEFTVVRLPSKETRIISNSCRAMRGRISNFNHKFCRLGKAGLNILKHKKPTVRGTAMNAVDHPHGGGTGKAGIGRTAPLTPWGKLAMGVKTTRFKKKLYLQTTFET